MLRPPPVSVSHALRRYGTVLGACLAAFVALPVAAAPAAMTVSIQDGAVHLVDTSTANNDIEVWWNFSEPSPPNTWLEVEEQGPQSLVPGTGCEQAGSTDVVHCTGFAPPMPLVIDMGPGNDQFHARVDESAMTFDGGPGNDFFFSEWNDNAVNVIRGGPGNDELLDTPGDDTLDGEDGDDLLHQQEQDGDASGTDVLDGGPGTDRVSYDGHGDTTLSIDDVANDGATGENEGDNILTTVENITGADGYDDHITGSDTANVIDGGGGFDVLDGGLGRDALNGGDGVDEVTYADRSDDLVVSIDGAPNDGADAEQDAIGLDVETVTTGSGDDRLTGSDETSYQEAFHGGAGDDVFDGKQGVDRFYGDDGTDTVTYANRTEDVTISLDSGGGEVGEGDQFDDTVENLIGGAGYDVVTGDNRANRLDGGPGNDQINGEAGSDTLLGGADSDVLDGGLGADTFTGGAGYRDVASYAGRSEDLLIDLGDAANDDGATNERDRIGPDVEDAIGGYGDDEITGTDQINKLDGGVGDDLLAVEGDGPDDVAECGPGTDVATADDGDEVLHCESVNPVVDTTAPSIVITTPADGQHFALDAFVLAQFTCADPGGSGVDTCVGEDVVDTSVAGTHPFSVTAVDNAGNARTVTVHYVVDEAAPPPPPPPPAAATPAPIVPRAVAPSTAAAVGTPALAVGAQLAVPKSGAVTVTVRCQGAATCAGTVAITAKDGSKVVKLGTATYAVAANGASKVKVKLSAVGRRLLKRRHGKLKATVAVTPKGAAKAASSRSVTLKQAR